MDHDHVAADQTVVVRGDRIVAFGPAAQVPVPAGATQVDGHGKYLIPGLADMHVHLRGSQSDPRVGDFLLALLATGVTTIRDMHSGGGTPNTASLGAWMLALRSQLARGALLGPRLYTAGDPDYASPAAAAASVAKLKADGHDFVKIYGTSRSPEVYDSLEASANRVGLRMVGHVPVNGLRWAIAAPLVSIEHLSEYARFIVGQDAQGQDWYGADALWNQPTYRLDATKLREIATATRQAGIWNCPTFSVTMKDPSDAASGLLFGESYLHLALQMVTGLHEAGAGLLSGTDLNSDEEGAQIRHPIVDELAPFVTAGLTPYEALKTSTVNVAQFLGTADSTGTVAVGKRADLVLLAGNPLNDIRQVQAVAGVMIGGRWLSKDELDHRLAVIAKDTNRSPPESP